MKILYIDDYKQDEELILRKLGVECARVTHEQAISGTGFSGLDKAATYVVRGLQLALQKYEQIWTRAVASGVTLATSPQSYAVGASFEEQYKLFGRLSPDALILSATSSSTEILQKIKDHGLHLPAFMRSDIESAAKYVGVEGCVIKSDAIEEVETVLGNLRLNVRGFSTFILKEVVDIAIDSTSGQRLEYRAIGIGGKLLDFDYDKSKHLIPDPSKLSLGVFAERAFALLARGGADGGLFLDVAVTASNEPIVVECKNLLTGTIVSIERFGRQLAKFDIA